METFVLYLNIETLFLKIRLEMRSKQSFEFDRFKKRHRFCDRFMAAA